MNNTLYAAYYADHACQQTAEVVENVEVARDTFRLRFRSPEVATRITPGQFVMVKLHGFDDPLIGRPLALYDVASEPDGEPHGKDCVDVVYLVKGKLTTRLCQLAPRQSIDMWGPLGNGFPPLPTRHLVMVAGGIGQTPFVALAKEYLGKVRYGQPAREFPAADRVTLCYGARTAAYLAGLDDFRQAGAEVRIATDDGSRGHHGFVTDLLEQVLQEASSLSSSTVSPQETTAGPRGSGGLEPEKLCVVCCGPEPMMQAVAELTANHGASCLVSLETPMACGVGICFTCVAKVRDASQAWDYQRTCVEGPVFDARRIVW